MKNKKNVIIIKVQYCFHLLLVYVLFNVSKSHLYQCFINYVTVSFIRNVESQADNTITCSAITLQQIRYPTLKSIIFVLFMIFSHKTVHCGFVDQKYDTTEINISGVHHIYTATLLNMLIPYTMFITKCVRHQSGQSYLCLSCSYNVLI
jgi:hypothetical protein